ncbi:transaldolase [Halenospora varia]|nr:transaldolase [Halenospora varia]
MAQTLLELLQSRTIVDCDTMDVEVPKTLGKYVDCTSNQAIAYFELQKPEHAEMIKNSIGLAQKLHETSYLDIPAKELAVELAMIYLQLAIAPHISGNIHIQTNPYHSYGSAKMISDSHRIIALVQHIDPNFDTSRLCLKIPSTWQGLQACKVLQSEGVKTLATTLFTMEQAALAAEVGCLYIAPYVNELRVHFDAGFKDENKAQKLCVDAQRYYEKYGYQTQVLPASLTSTDEIMALAGVHHITIAPSLLVELKQKSVDGLSVKSLFDGENEEVWGKGEEKVWGGDESGWRMAFTRSKGGDGEGERKLVQVS